MQRGGELAAGGRRAGGELAPEDARHLVHAEPAGLGEARGDLLRERLHKERGAPHRRDGFEQPGPLLYEGIEAWRERTVGRDRDGETAEAVGLTVGRGSEQRLEVREVMEHAPQRNAGPLRDARRRRAQIAFTHQLEQGIDDQPARPRAAREAPVAPGVRGGQHRRPRRLLH